MNAFIVLICGLLVSNAERVGCGCLWFAHVLLETFQVLVNALGLDGFIVVGICGLLFALYLLRVHSHNLNRDVAPTLEQFLEPSLCNGNCTSLALLNFGMEIVAVSVIAEIHVGGHIGFMLDSHAFGTILEAS